MGGTCSSVQVNALHYEVLMAGLEMQLYPQSPAGQGRLLSTRRYAGHQTANVYALVVKQLIIIEESRASHFQACHHVRDNNACQMCFWSRSSAQAEGGVT